MGDGNFDNHAALAGQGSAIVDGDPVYRSILENVSDGIYLVDRDRRITYWNKGAERITGFTTAEMIGAHCWDNRLRHVDELGTTLCHGFCPLVQTVTDGQTRQEHLFFRHKAGHRVPVSVRVMPIHDADGRIAGGIEIFTDNSTLAAAGERLRELEQLAMLDTLTQIPNRRYLEMNLQARLSELQRYGWPFGVCFIDVDHFKEINDTHGHAAGDRILQLVARTLLNNNRYFDLCGRWGGEEFLALIVNVENHKLQAIAERCRTLLAASSLTLPAETGDILRVTVSVGATLARPEDTPEGLVQRADELMYRSKQAGRNRVTAG